MNNKKNLKALSIICSAFFMLTPCAAQKWKEPLENSIAQLLKEKEMKHAILSIAIMNTDTKEIIFEKNSEVGLPAASTQKLFTAITAWELYGGNYTFATKFFADKLQKNNLIITPAYDPTLGSWRYSNTQSKNIIDSLQHALGKRFQDINSIYITHSYPALFNGISDGWIYEDLGNYYGAACLPFIWRENQFDCNLEKKQNGYAIKNFIPVGMQDIVSVKNVLTIGSANSGDNSCAYKQGNSYLLKGSFGSEVAMPVMSLSGNASSLLQCDWKNATSKLPTIKEEKYSAKNLQLIYTHQSPTLDSINYWFLKKSINLYGESLLRNMAFTNYKTDDYEKGISTIYQLCSKVGIDSSAVHIFDGCGLSPQNRLTTKALASLLQYAYKRPYSNALYTSLPLINGMNMKSGSIHGVRAYAGYIHSSDEQHYAFAIIAHNYSGSGKAMQNKLWTVLDNLK